MSTVLNSGIKHDPAKHEAIMEHAILIFAADGYARADVQAIADAAGVGKGTVYRYFGSKLELFYACTLEIGKRVDERVADAIDQIDSPLEKIRTALEIYADFFDESPDYLELWVQDRAEFRGVMPESHYQYHNKQIDGFADILQQAVDAGEIWPVVARKTVITMANLFLGNLVYTCCYGFPEGSKQTAADMAKHAMDVFLRGLLKNPGPCPEDRQLDDGKEDPGTGMRNLDGSAI